MKRCLALLLTAVLLFGCLPAMAADYTVDEKFFRQMEQNAVRGTLTFSVVGALGTKEAENEQDAPETLLPRLSLEISHCLNRGEGEAAVSLLLDSECLCDWKLLYNDTLAAAGGSLLPSRVVFPRDWDPMTLLRSDRGQTGMQAALALLMAGWSAPAERKDEIERLLEKYTAELSIFVNGYTDAETGSADGILYSQLSCSLEPEALKEETQKLIRELCADEALLSALRQIAPSGDAAALLNPASAQILCDAVGKLELNEPVRVLRRYDVMGQPLLDSITLPFGKDQPFQEVTLSAEAAEQGTCYTAAGKKQDGTEFTFNCVMASPLSLKGAFSLTRPDGTETAFDYAFDWQEEEETYSLQTDVCERLMRGEMTVTPTAGDIQGAHVTLDVRFSSRSEKRSPSYLDAGLCWQKADGGTVTTDLALKTAAVWTVESLDETEGALRPDQAGEEEKAQWLKELKQNLSAWLTGFTLRTAMPAPTENGLQK